MQISVKNPEVLLIIAPWDLPVTFLECRATIRIMQDTEMPRDISQETWNSITILLKWNYPQLHTAGCNHIEDKHLFEDSDVSFCMTNGVIATFPAFQHHYEDTEDAVGLRMCVYHPSTRMKDKILFSSDALGMDSPKRDNSYVEAGLADPNGDIPSRWYHGCDQLNEFLAGLDLLFQALGKRNAFVSNVGRGPIVDTDDLVAALNNGTIRGAAVDVTGPEPLPAGHPLWKARNVFTSAKKKHK
ncbi:D-isomer specific 2-hydroxyacid dehydrogenase [Aspergillus tamarii]|uniref:D-isomer specific 2-hydroxyacid dehydrogenase n=1 Tax=Aspergillus tamarii TaxID=41984 RepID=A0A5N6UT95_ASPTM|nr:D-isomer specific 2-hydroxyacid dehydrogenase [Aspergillus tamarii]